MDVSLIASYLLHSVGAFALALPIGWERQTSSRSAGLRTFPLVATASCAYMMLGIALTGHSPEAHARIIQGLLTGMGFIGGGAIIKSQRRVRGTATAASLWMTGAIGAAVAFDIWELAITLSLLTFAALWTLTRFEHRRRRARRAMRFELPEERP